VPSRKSSAYAELPEAVVSEDNLASLNQTGANSGGLPVRLFAPTATLFAGSPASTADPGCGEGGDCCEFPAEPVNDAAAPSAAPLPFERCLLLGLSPPPQGDAVSFRFGAEPPPEGLPVERRAWPGRSEEEREREAGLKSRRLRAAPRQRRAFRFDVANGNGVPGMALKMRDALARRGIHAARVTNKRPFNTESTEIQYLIGFEKEAERVRTAMASHVTMKPVSVIAGTQDVRLVLGRDAAGHVALMGEAPLLALNGTQAPQATRRLQEKRKQA